MARIRTIKPEFWQDQKLAAELTREQRLFYVALWNEADDDGRLMANPRRLLGFIFPFDDDLSEAFIEDSLRALARTGRLVLYTVDGTPYAQLTKFAEHQRINRPTASRIPSPDSDLAETHGALSDNSVSPQPPEVGTGEVGSRNRGTGDTHTHTARESRDVENSDPLAAWLGEFGHVLDECPPARTPETRAALFQHFGPPGLRANAWRKADGSSVPIEDRPRLLALAISGYAGEGKHQVVTAEFAGMLRRVVHDETQAIEKPGSVRTIYDEDERVAS